MPLLPIIALSAHNEAERTSKHQSGFDADVEKPIRKADLIETSEPMWAIFTSGIAGYG
jgi:CheY-like chemotaxis protein